MSFLNIYATFAFLKFIFVFYCTHLLLYMYAATNTNPFFFIILMETCVNSRSQKSLQTTHNWGKILQNNFVLRSV